MLTVCSSLSWVQGFERLLENCRDLLQSRCPLLRGKKVHVQCKVYLFIYYDFGLLYPVNKVIIQFLGNLSYVDQCLLMPNRISSFCNRLKFSGNRNTDKMWRRLYLCAVRDQILCTSILFSCVYVCVPAYICACWLLAFVHAYVCHLTQYWHLLSQTIFKVGK